MPKIHRVFGIDSARTPSVDDPTLLKAKYRLPSNHTAHRWDNSELCLSIRELRKRVADQDHFMKAVFDGPKHFTLWKC